MGLLSGETWVSKCEETQDMTVERGVFQSFFREIIFRK